MFFDSFFTSCLLWYSCGYSQFLWRIIYCLRQRAYVLIGAIMFICLLAELRKNLFDRFSQNSAESWNMATQEKSLVVISITLR